MIPHTCVKNAYKMVVSILVPTGYTEPSPKIYLQLNITTNIVEGNYLWLFSSNTIFIVLIFASIGYCLSSNPHMTCHSFVSSVILNLTPSHFQLTSASLRIQYHYSLNNGEYWYSSHKLGRLNNTFCWWHYGVDYTLSMDFLAISIYVNAYFKFVL